jgi:hypothetical protein
MAYSDPMDTSNAHIVYNIECYENSTSIPYNSSNVTIIVDCWRDDAYSTHGSGTCYCKINGITYSQAISSNQYINSDGVHLFEKTLDIEHNPDGTKNLTISAWIDHSQFSSEEQSWTTPLSNIPRYATITSFECTAKTVNTMTLSFTTDVSCDYAQYKLDNGSWTNLHNDGVIASLTPNTTYSVKIKVRRTDSQLWTESDAISVTTYDIAKITSAPNIDHGSNDVIQISNPSSATMSLVLKIGNTQILSKTPTTGSNTITFTDAQLDTIYKLYGNGNTLTLTHTLSITVNSTTYTDTKTCTITLKGNQHTMRTNVNGTWKRGNIWTKVNGTWRRAVVWTKVNGTWQRGI